jgi:hypothetical protein
MNDIHSSNRSELARIAADFSFSSNLLALQLAVETAGAPAKELEGGADEVRELAQCGEQAVQPARQRKAEKNS